MIKKQPKKRLNVRVAGATQKELEFLLQDGQYSTLTTAVAVAVRELYQRKQQLKVKTVLCKTIEWLNNLEDDVGLDKLLNAMPSNFSGRVALQELINQVEVT